HAPKPHRPGRRRQALGRLLLTLGVLVTALWISTNWWGFGYSGPTRVAEAGAGWCRIGVSVGDSPSRFSRKGWYAGFPWDQWRWLLPIRANIGGTDFPREWNGRLVSFELYRWDVINTTGAVIGSGATYTTYILLWPIAVCLFSAGGALLWLSRRARRRAALPICSFCGYDLANLAPNAPCPECGQARPTGPIGPTSPI
ncbi:MAG: hypothetical protein ACREJO_17890, partial [Phycisphaerales bacterium]